MSLYCALKLVENVHDVISNDREWIDYKIRSLFIQSGFEKHIEKNKNFVDGETSHCEHFIVIYIQIDSTETALFKTFDRKILSEIICYFSRFFIFAAKKNQMYSRNTPRNKNLRSFREIKAPKRNHQKLLSF